MSTITASTSFTRTSLALAACATLALGACDKGSKGGSSGAGATSGGLTKASAVAPSGGLKRALSIMPSSSEFVMAVDWKQASASPLWTKYRDRAMRDIADKVAEFKATCGWDPFEKITGLLMAGRDRGREGTFMVRGLEKGPVIECLKKFQTKAEAEGKTNKVVLDGDYLELTEEGDDTPARFLFIDDTTALAGFRGETMVGKADLVALAGAKDGEGLMASQTFVSIIDGLDTGATLWFVVNGKAPFVAEAVPMPLVAAFGAVRVADGVDGAVSLRMADADTASKTVATAKMFMSQVEGTPYAPYVKKVKVETKGADVRASFQFDGTQLEEMAGHLRNLPF